MEFNLIENGIHTLNSCFKQNLEQEIEGEIIIPDYYPEISKILKCRVTPFVLSKELNGTSLTIEGNAIVSIIYSDEEKRISCYRYSLNFSKNTDIEKTVEEPIISVEIGTPKINCKAQSPRKILINGYVNLGLEVKSQTAISVVNEIEGNSVCCKKEKIEYTSFDGYFEKNIIIEDEIPLPTTEEAFGSLVRVNMCCNISECKVVGEKAVIRGDLIIDGSYTNEASKIKEFRSSHGFSQIMEIGGDIDDSTVCECKPTVVFYDIKPKISADGTVKCMNMETKILIKLYKNSNRKTEVVTDAFCVNCDNECHYDSIDYLKMQNKISERFLCKKNIDFSDGSFTEVYDCWCDVKETVGRIENGLCTVNGNINICVLGCDENGTPEYIEKTIDFNYSCETDKNTNCTAPSCNVKITAVEYSNHVNGSMEVKAEILIECSIMAVQRISYLKGLCANAKLESDDDVGLVIYYCNSDETVWNIAKSYTTSPEDIMAVNNLSEETIKKCQPLVIPL